MSGLVNTLLVDIGNSRTKCCLASDISSVSYISDINSFDELSKHVSNCLIANVGSQQQLNRIIHVLNKNRIDIELLETRDGVDDLKLNYQQPELLGVDRWLAMLAVKQHCASNFAVIDLGTAMTCDVVNQCNQHLGGWIVPGYTTMIETLKIKTVLAHAKSNHVSDNLSFGRDTSSCISEGCRAQINGFVFMVQQQMQKIFSTYKIFITGGDANLVNIDDFSHTELIENCIFEGMKRLI